MKSFFVFLFFAATLAVFSVQASNLDTGASLAGQNVESTAAPAVILDGIPLFRGLQISTDKKLTDPLPASDFTTSVATVGVVDIDDVFNFYKRTLPPLGWRLVGSRDFVRGTERLHINTHADGKTSVVTFSEEQG